MFSESDMLAEWKIENYAQGAVSAHLYLTTNTVRIVEKSQDNVGRLKKLSAQLGFVNDAGQILSRMVFANAQAVARNKKVS